MKRRAFLSLPTVSAGSLVAAAWPGAAWAEAAPQEAERRFTSEDLKAHDLQVPGQRSLARRALVLAPRHLKPGTRPRALVLLHGLGETGNEELGIRAWAELYGLIAAHERLRRPPLERVLPQARYLSDERLEELNRSLAEHPFEGLLLICPVTPNPHKPGPAARTLDEYTAWLFDSLLPAVRERVAPFSTLGIDGCSLGGYAALEVFLRRPAAFATLGTVQGAFGEERAEHYATRIATALDGKRSVPIHVETSSQDPYRKANELLARRLGALGVAATLRVPPGPHNQPWLREIGTLEMLLWHDRHLRSS
jgi:predicted esterase